jgi:hypothetical protein
MFQARMNAISFSLYGSHSKYCVGMLRNIELAERIYPGWKVYVYVDSTVPAAYIEQYRRYDYVTLVDMTDSGYPGMFWRFLCPEDTFIVRDTDSRLSLRERYCVDEWIHSGLKFHIMRDALAHNALTWLGGTWGMNRNTSGPNIDMVKTVKVWLSQNTDVEAYGKDQEFLRGLYAYYYPQNCIMIHDSIGSYGDKSVPFPSRLAPDYKFVGEVYDENECRRQDHIDDWLNNVEMERLPNE